MPNRRIDASDPSPDAIDRCDGAFLTSIDTLGQQFDAGRPAMLCLRSPGEGSISPAADVAVFCAGGPVVVVCGSCSPVSARQVSAAVADGFAEVILSPNALAAGEINSAVASAVAMVTLALDGGRSVVLHTHCEHRVEHTPADDAHLGDALGRVLLLTLERRPVRRVVVVGGETCGHVAGTLGIDTVEIVAALGDGLHQCRIYSGTATVDRVGFVFKHGAAGGANVFACLRDG